MSSVRLSSRFNMLRVMDECPDSSDEDCPPVALGENVQTKLKLSASSGEGMSANAKKRAKKRKNKQQSTELRDVAPSNPPLATHTGGPPVGGLDRMPLGLPVNTRHPTATTQQWDEWKRKDNGNVDNQYENDLQSAILASKIDYEHQQEFLDGLGTHLTPPVGNRKDRRKHLQGKERAHAVSLQEFQATPTGIDTIDDIQVVKKPEPDPEFFNKVDRDVKEILSREGREKLKKTNQKLASDTARRVEYEDNIDKRDNEILQARNAMDKMKEELGQVKKRNKQLCVILAQGEMKEKADILKQVDELTTVKDELTAEVSELHASLEQERSKVSTLKSELQRLHDRKK